MMQRTHNFKSSFKALKVLCKQYDPGKYIDTAYSVNKLR